MIDSFEKTENLFKHIREYVTLQKNLIRLESVETISKFISYTITICIISLFFSIGLIFCSLGLSYYVSELLGEKYWGFIIVGLLYLLISIIIWKSSIRLLQIPIINYLFKYFFKIKK